MQTKHPYVGCVILASGQSIRFGSNKLLTTYYNKPLIMAILESTTLPFGNRRVVVTRHKEIEAICISKQIPVILHDLPNRNDTIRLGLDYLIRQSSHSDQSLEGCLFAVSDQPLLSQETLTGMISSFLENKNHSNQILRLGYNNKVGNPVLFGKSYFPELLSLPEKKGGGFLIHKYPEYTTTFPAKSEYELYDIDTPKDLTFLKQSK